MKDSEKILATGLFTLLIVLWLGFVFHRSDSFAGSLWGAVFAISGSILILAPAVYSLVKRNQWLKKKLKPYVSMKTLLKWHIYAGIIGPILVIIHTGHKFDSVLGVMLTSTLLIVVASGFVGRYLMGQFSVELKDKNRQLVKLRTRFDEISKEINSQPSLKDSLPILHKPILRYFFLKFIENKPLHATSSSPSLGEIALVTEAIADVEYSIKTHEFFRLWFGRWLGWHIVISICFYAFLILHIVASTYYGLRWLN